MLVGEQPGDAEDVAGHPFVGPAGRLLDRALADAGIDRTRVYLTNVVKHRLPSGQSLQPDEIAACAPFLRRQLEILDPALVVTLGRHSLGRFMPGARISQVHGTVGPVDPATGAANALAFALYHPAAALRTPEIERTSYRDVAGIPAALLESRARRGSAGTAAPATVPDVEATVGVAVAVGESAPVLNPGVATAMARGAHPDGDANDPDFTLF
jgi:DNA polymerase